MIDSKGTINDIH